MRNLQFERHLAEAKARARIVRLRQIASSLSESKNSRNAALNQLRQIEARVAA